MTAAKKVVEVQAVQVWEIPHAELLVSEWETRKTLDQAALKELAASIKANGIQEPLIVRKLEAPKGWNDGPRFEIVAGQRRFEASKIAGKTSCPCIVRELSDVEAHEQRIVSNLQRQDLEPLEEAQAFSTLLCVSGATIETVAAKLAKTPSYIGRRLKLLDAIEPVREALKAGAIEVGHALELARLDEKLQRRLLEYLNVGYRDCTTDPEDDSEDVDETGVCKYCGCCEDDACELDSGANCSWANDEKTICTNPDCLAQMKFEADSPAYYPTPRSVADLRREIERSTLRVLSDAPFPLADEIPPMSCTECPKRSGNASLLFEDCAQDTCTDRECFDSKVKVWIKAELEGADRAKNPLVMLSDGYQSEHRATVDKWEVVVIPEQKPVILCEKQEEAIWINGKNAGRRTMICRDAKCLVHKSQSNHLGYSSDPEKEKADRKKKLEKLNAEKKYRAALFHAVAVAPIQTLYATDLNLEVCLYALGRAPGQYSKKVAEALGWDAKVFEWNGSKQLRETLLKLAPAERLRVALVAAHSGELSVNEYSSTSKPEDLERLAALLGLDPKKIRASVAPKSTVKPIKPMAPKAKSKKTAAKPITKKAPAKKTAKKAAAKKGGEA
jgi:ParB/RepB/Spo0J family partition protein